MTGPVITLTDEEMADGAYWGARVVLNAIRKHRVHTTKSLKGNPAWTENIEAALSEIAVQKWTGHEGTLRQDDSGLIDFPTLMTDVKHTMLPNGRLPIRKEYRSDLRYLLAIGSKGVYRMVGWCWGDEGKRAEWWDERIADPAYMVPQRALRTPASLLEIARATKCQ